MHVQETLFLIIKQKKDSNSSNNEELYPTYGLVVQFGVDC